MWQASLPESELHILSCIFSNNAMYQGSRMKDPLHRNCFWIVLKFYDFNISNILTRILIQIQITIKTIKTFENICEYLPPWGPQLWVVMFCVFRHLWGQLCSALPCPDRYLLSLLPGHSATALISVQEPRQIEQTQEEEEEEGKLTAGLEGPHHPPPRLSFATLVKSMTQLKTAKMRKNSTLLRAGAHQRQQGQDEEQPDMAQGDFNKSEYDQEINN